MWWWLIPAAVVVFFIIGDDLFRLKFTYQAWRAGKKLPPFSLRRPLGLAFAIDNIIHDYKNTALERWVEMIEQAGYETYGVIALNKMLIMTQEPENIKAILATSFKDYSLGVRHPALGAFLGDGIFTLSGEGWKHSRTMLRPQFSREQVSHMDSMGEHCNVMIGNLNKAYAQGEYIDIQHQFHLLTMDTATEFLFGESTDSLENSQRTSDGISAAQFVQDYETCLHWSVLRLVIGPIYYVINPKSYRDAIARSRAFVSYFAKRAIEYVEKHPETEKDSTDSSKKYVFSRELAKVTKDPIVIRDQAFNILLAGRDTTASLLSYIIWFLGNDNRVFEKLRERVISDFGYSTEAITFESLKRCTYLSWVINEVLRLNPVVPRNFRQTTRDSVLPRGGGPDGSEPIFVPRDTQVIYSVYELHRNPKLWGPNATDFVPERWGSGETHNWDYLPFNGGPRICLGQQFALTEVSFTIIRLLQTYDRIELRDLGKPLRNSVRLTSNVLGGVWVKMHPTRSTELK